MDTFLKYILLDNETDSIASFKSGTRNRRENDVYSNFKSKFIYVMLSHLSDSWCSSDAMKILQQVKMLSHYK
jgi:hypothetical protein